MNAKVVSQEEVDALMRGFDAGSADPAPPRPGAIPLRPGEAVAVPLEPPPARSRPRPVWSEGPRPIDALLTRRPRAAAAPAGWFPLRARRPAEREVTDYWPAYADVLSNVVLNLLFLVAILTMGLVVLNQEVIRVQVRLAEERARAIIEQRRLEARAPVRPSPEPGQRLPAVPETAPPSQPAAPPAVAPAETAPAPERPVREFTMRRAPSASPAPAVAPLSATPSPPITAEGAAIGLVGGRFVARLTFDLRETAWPAGRPIVGAESVSLEDRRALVAFAPPDNRRLMTQAFSRLSSVRSAMLAAGVPARNIVLRIAPLPQELEGDEIASSSVYVINLGGP